VNGLPAIADAISRVLERAAAAAVRAGRSPADVRLMAVSKFQAPEAIAEAYRAGVRLFGESRVQEAKEKFSAIDYDYPGAELHLIGGLQRNKARSAVELFSCVQSVDRDELVEELARRASAAGKAVDILLELHTGEASKSGYPDADALLRAAELASASPGLRLRGLMTMAPFTEDPVPVRAAFRDARAAFERLRSAFPGGTVDILSMGMTGDFETAIEEGSTLIRVGTAIFGARPTYGSKA